MSGTQSVVVGDKGRIVVPAEVRAARNWTAGTVLVLVETPDGLLLTERGSALRMVRERLRGRSLVDELEGERRDAARAEER
ncbi:AbrB/MazE/SpoVT family DNA-binding domain-containing protein [Amnibacterium endophyticum]|uniref:AbrB/MazE/SpoVT family DNA-binding domain-containing protein n=1 Tax=Amnibacterium endophyticum TaxID=2109337 RepID=A0ABW4LJK5_9MICO